MGQTWVFLVVQPHLAQGYWVNNPDTTLLGVRPDLRLLDLVFKMNLKLLSLVLQKDPLKLELNKFNIIINIKNTIICIINITIGIIINIINITLRSDVVARLKSLGSNVAARLTPGALGSLGVARFKPRALRSGLQIDLNPKLLGCSSQTQCSWVWLSR